MMRGNKKKTALIITGAVIVVIGIGVAVWFLVGKTGQGSNSAQPVSGQTVYDAQLGFGITIPDAWQGKYQMSSGPQAVSFIYTGGGSPYVPIFTIYAYPQKDWDALQKSTGLVVYITAHNGTVLGYNLTPNNPYTGAAAQEFGNFLKEAPQVLQTVQFSGK